MLPKPCSFLSTSEIQDRRELRSFCLLRPSGLARPSNLQRKQLSHSLTPPLQQRGRGLYYVLQRSRFLPKLAAHTLSRSPFTEERGGGGLLLRLLTMVSLLIALPDYRLCLPRSSIYILLLLLFYSLSHCLSNTLLFTMYPLLVYSSTE